MTQEQTDKKVLVMLEIDIIELSPLLILPDVKEIFLVKTNDSTAVIL